MAMDHVSAVEVELPRRSRQQTSTHFQEIEHIHPQAGKAEKEQEMSNQIFKSLTMLTLVVGLTLAAAVVSANGQSTSTLVTADIPFDFIVGDQTLPSGKYIVRSASDDGKALKISSRDGESSVVRLTNVADEKTKRRMARMVFHRYGQQYFLAEVWTGDTYGRQLLKCKRERHLRQELASNGSKSEATYEVVEVVAQVR